MNTQVVIDRETLCKLLEVSQDHKAFKHGQIRRVASHIVKTHGYHWAFGGVAINQEETIRFIQIRRQLRRVVFESIGGWHSNKSVVWARIQDYVKRVGARFETRVILRKLSGSSDLNQK
jgi:hypothetical protein